jgi:hypothetical protein
MYLRRTEMKKVVSVIVFLILVSLPATGKAQEATLWDGFEGELMWVPVDWENVGQVELSLNDEEATEHTHSLKVDMMEESIGWKNKVTFSREDSLNLEGAKVVMDVYAPYDPGINIAIGFDTGDEWTFYESEITPLKKGWNKDITFDLVDLNFKCRESEWKYNRKLTDADNIKKMHIMIYRPSRMEVQTVYIDNIRIK